MEKLPWMQRHFDDRQIKEIEFCSLYNAEFSHGTDGHNAKIIIAHLVGLMNRLHFELVGRNYPENIDPIMGYDLQEEGLLIEDKRE